MYQAIFTQFFLRFSHNFLAHPINLKGLVVFLCFSKTYAYFQGLFYKILGQFRDKRHFFFKFQEFSKTRSNSRTFPGLFEPCKSMSHIICDINPQIQFVDICWGHGMRSLFHPLWPWSQESVLEKMHTQQIAYFIYGSISYLACRYIFGPGGSPTVSMSLWPWRLVSVLARSSSGHICI